MMIKNLLKVLKNSLKIETKRRIMKHHLMKIMKVRTKKKKRRSPKMNSYQKMRMVKLNHQMMKGPLIKIKVLKNK